MARTLTGGATTAKNARSVRAVWLVESSTLNVHWSTGLPSSTGGFTWERRLRSISEIELSVPPLGGLASAQTVTITVIESATGNSLRGLLNTYGQLEGADLTVSLLFQGEAYADRIKVFTGVIDHVQWSTGVNGGLGQLIAVDTSVTNAPAVPSAVFSTAEYPNIVAGLVGQIKPILYGSASLGLDHAPLHLINRTTYAWLAASHPLDTFPTTQVVVTGATGGVFTLNGDCATNTSTAILTGNRALSQSSFFFVATRSISTDINTNSPSNLIDSNNATFAYIWPLTADSNGEGTAAIGVAATFGANTTGLNELEIQVNQLKRGVASTTSSTVQLLVHTINATSKAVLVSTVAREGPYSWGTNYRDLTIIETGLSFGGPVGVEVVLQLTREGGLINDLDYRWLCGEIYVYGRYRVSDDFQQLYSGTGIGGREDTDGHITGSAGLVLSRCADILQSILEVYLGLTVENTSFDVARDIQVWDGDFWYFAFGLGAGWARQQLQATELLDQLALQSQCFLFPSGAGTFKLLAIQTTPTSQYSFTVSTMDNTIVETSRMEEVFHTYTILYDWSPLTGQFAGSVTASPGGCTHSNATIAAQLTTLCSDSMDRYGDLPPLVVEAWGIVMESSAEDQLEKLVRRHWSQSILVTWDAPYVGIHVEVGDGVTITHAELPTAVSGQIFRVLRVTLRPEDGSDTSFPLQLQAQSAAL